MTTSLTTMRRCALRAGLGVLALSLAATAQAVRLNPEGTGQVLLFPYYTTRAGNATFITLVNESDRAKVLSVKLDEARNGRKVGGVNVYLAAHDTWTATVTSLGDGQPANLFSSDPSCVYPRLALELPGSTQRYTPLDPSFYTGALNDAGPDNLERLREGSITVIEAATVVPNSPIAKALVPDTATGVPADCAGIVAAWDAPEGAWAQDRSRYLSNPTGGVSGEAFILNVANGTVTGFHATALDDLRTDPADLPQGSKNSLVLHTRPGDAAEPSLANAVNDPGAGVARATIDLPRRRVELEYPVARGIDAVSAVLMADTASMTFSSDETAGATTEWVVSFPTRPFYTDPAIVGGTAIAPYSSVYPLTGNDAAGAATVLYTLYDRSARRITVADSFSMRSEIKLPYVTQVVSLMPRTANEVSTPAGPLGSDLNVDLQRVAALAERTGGWIEFNLRTNGSGGGNRALRPAVDGTVMYGLPAIGFAAVNYINGGQANYSFATPQRRTLECRRNTSSCESAVQ